MLKSKLFNGAAIILMGLFMGCGSNGTLNSESSEFSINLIGVDDLQIVSASKDSMRKGVDYLQLLITSGPPVDIEVRWHDRRNPKNFSALASVDTSKIEYNSDGFAIEGVVDFWGEAMKWQTDEDIKKILIHEILHVIAFNWKILHRIGLIKKNQKYWLENSKAGEAYLHLQGRGDLIYNVAQRIYHVPMDPGGVHWANNTQLWDIMDPTYSGGIASVSSAKLLEEVGYEVELVYSEVPNQSKIDESKNYCRDHEDRCFYTMPND